ncbi:MAG: LapA family protein [Elusimicrobiota bacterium]
MWLLRRLVAFLVFFLFLWFTAINTKPVQVNFFGKQTGDLPLALVILISFATGVCFWFLVSLYHDLKMRREISGKDKIIANLKKELSNLRNLPLTDEAEISTETMIMNKDEIARDSRSIMQDLDKPKE